MRGISTVHRAGSSTRFSSRLILKRALSWTQFGSKSSEVNDNDGVQLYSERRLLGYSKEQVQLAFSSY
jgi:hypothetical protein